MNRMRVLTALATVTVVLAASPWGFPESISLVSSGGGIYDYALETPIEVDFIPNATIALSGLSGVTGASVASTLAGCFSLGPFTPSSVVLAQTKFSSASCGLAGFFLPQGTLTVDSWC
jgi:hypothetical protein